MALFVFIGQFQPTIKCYHVNYIRSKVVSKLKMLDKYRNVLNEHTKLILYKTLIVPLFNYADIIYYGISQKDSNTLQRLQNSALRIVLNRNKREHIVDMHSELNLLQLGTRRKHHVCQQVFKGLNNLAPSYITNNLNYVSSEHNMCSRAEVDQNFRIVKCRLELSKKNFFSIGPKFWNPLDTDIKQSNTYDNFKHNLYISIEAVKPYYIECNCLLLAVIFFLSTIPLPSFLTKLYTPILIESKELYMSIP